MRRQSIYPHKSLRHMPFRMNFLVQGLATAVVFDVLALWQMQRILEWHTRLVQLLLDWAKVPWEKGREIKILPGITAELLQTRYLDYQEHPAYPWIFLGGAIALFLATYYVLPAPMKLLILLLPASLAVTLIYLKAFSPSLPYTGEDFCSIWYYGESFLWLLIPWIFAVSFYTLAVPFLMKVNWVPLMIVYAFVWSAVRLALALATFYYFGDIWMPFFYFVLGFLADFLYIVAFYSLAMDRAATWLAKRREVWQ